MKAAILGLALVCGVVYGANYWSRPEPETPEAGTPVPLPVEMASWQAYEARAGCRWAHPGRDPFRGDMTSALASLGVPPALRGQFASRISYGDADEVVRASPQTIVGLRSHTLYASGIGMTFGRNIICYNTRTTTVQEGKLYIEGGYHIWVPYVCGNVSRLLPWSEAREYERSGRGVVVPGVVRRAQPYAPIPSAKQQVANNTVLLPDTAVLLFLPLLFLVWRFRK